MGTPLPVELDILGWSDSLILMVLALVVFGPRRLPQIGRQIGKLMYEFRKASNEFKFQMEEELRAAEEADRRKREEERLRALALKAPAAEAPATPPVTSSGSPYSEDVVYPPTAPAAESQSAAPAGTQSIEAQLNEMEPRILPPSTGEPVPAARPGSAASGPALEFEFSGEARNGNGSGAGPERGLMATEEARPENEPPKGEGAEQAAHHG